MLAELPQQEERKITLERARQAALLRGAEQVRDQRRAEEQTAQQTATQAAARAQLAAQANKTAADTLNAEQARKGERDAAAERVRQLDAWTGQVAELEAARHAAAAAEQAYNVAKLAREKAEQALADVLAELLVQRPRLAEAQLQAAKVEGLQHKAMDCQRICELRQAFDATRRQHALATAAVDQSQKALEASTVARQQARAQLESLAEARVRGQATLLARQLVANEACPVCGATEHPHPASSEEAPPDEQTIEAARAGLQRAEQQLDQARAALATREQALAGHAALLGPQEAQLGAAQTMELPDLKAQADAAHAALVAAQGQAKELPALAVGVQRWEERLSAAELERTKADTELAAQSGNLQAAGGLCQERERGIPEHLRKDGALAAARAQAASQVQALEQALVAATQQATAAGSAAAAATATSQAAQEAHDAAQARAASAELAFAAGWRDASFASEEGYRGARRAPAELDGLEAAIGRFAEALAVARKEAADAAAQAQGVVAPDLAGLEAAAQQAATHHTQSVTEVARLQEQLRGLEQILVKLRQLAAEFARDEEEHRVLATLAQAASGTNPRRLTFERYVLAALLDGVLVAASSRLSRMSQGRYTLQRAQGVGDQRRAGGLELEVLDAYTGRERAVGTLSGGEGFLASLSLALGLADVVQAQSGGIHLDAIFVDEGFGSLDPAALDEAVGALLELQAGGRLVGIISHVTELQSRIDARLEVVREQGGSRTRFVLP